MRRRSDKKKKDSMQRSGEQKERKYEFQTG